MDRYMQEIEDRNNMIEELKKERMELLKNKENLEKTIQDDNGTLQLIDCTIECLNDDFQKLENFDIELKEYLRYTKSDFVEALPFGGIMIVAAFYYGKPDLLELLISGSFGTILGSALYTVLPPIMDKIEYFITSKTFKIEEQEINLYVLEETKKGITRSIEMAKKELESNNLEISSNEMQVAICEEEIGTLKMTRDAIIEEAISELVEEKANAMDEVSFGSKKENTRGKRSRAKAKSRSKKN